MSFFQNLSNTGIANIEIKVVIKDGIVSVLVDPKSTARDKAIQTIQPISISGTAEELDAEFFNIISEPLKKTSGIISNIEEHEKSADEAAKQKSEEKKKATSKTKAGDKKPVEKTEDSENSESESKPADKIKEPKPEKPKKPEPESKFKKYEDAVLEIINAPGFKLKATNKLQLKEKVDFLLVMDKTNKLGLEWEAKIKSFVPSMFDDDEDDLNEQIAETPTEEITHEKIVAETIVETDAPAPPPPADDEENPFDDDDDDDLPYNYAESFNE